jgi:hypothetical protein
MDIETLLHTPFAAGEPLPWLIEALRRCKPQMMPDGRWCVDAELDPAVAAPLIRALMRAEAEMLEEDSLTIRGNHLIPDRSPDQRRADAFLYVILQVIDARRRRGDPRRHVGQAGSAERLTKAQS